LHESGLLLIINDRFGTLLDFYEEEEIESANVIFYIADSLDELFNCHEINILVEELISMLLLAVKNGRCLTFRF
jgi:hypothetical protein